MTVRTDQEIVNDVELKINELNSLMAEASRNGITIWVNQLANHTFGSPVPSIWLNFRAVKEEVLRANNVMYTGGH